MEGESYRFGEAKDSIETYSDGVTVPHRQQMIERSVDGGVIWRRVGYVEIHAHRVKRDATDVEDISIGVTVRINPKIEA